MKCVESGNYACNYKINPILLSSDKYETKSADKATKRLKGIDKGHDAARFLLAHDGGDG